MNKPTVVTMMIVSMAVFASTLSAKAQFGGTETQGTQSQVFMRQATEMNAAEVQLSRLAESKSQDQRVKDFAQMMVKDHTQALNRLNGTGSSTATQESGLTPPLSKEHQQLYERLSKLSGADFDRQYMDAMVADHRKATAFLVQHGGVATSSNGNPGNNRQKPEALPGGVGGTGGTGTTNDGTDATNLSREFLPTVRQHLQMAESIQRELQGGKTGRR